MSTESALNEMRAVVGARGVVGDPDRIAAMQSDERGLYQGRAALIVQPATTAEVAAVLRIAHAAGIGMVPHGGNTGYCGGATPDPSGTQIMISLARLNRIRALDPLGFTVTAEAGVVLADLQQAAAAQDCLFPLRMGSEGSAQIGGMLSTNAGGMAVLRYGTARDLALGLEVVLADGTVLDQLSALRKDNTGYSLRDLFIGAEGSLGIITAAVLKLYPGTQARLTALLAVRDLASVCALLGVARRASGECVSAFEYICGRSLRLVLDHDPGARSPFASLHDHYVLIEFSSSDSEARLDAAAERILALGTESIIDGVVAQSDTQTRELWRLREGIPQAEKRAGGSIKHDVSVPIADIPEFCRRAEHAVAELLPAARLSVYGHVGDGNVHFNVLAPAATPDPAFRERWTAPVSHAVHELAAQLRGSFSAEHGIGVLKRDDLVRYKPPAALQAMRLLKTALDPRGVMNPGKVLV